MLRERAAATSCYRVPLDAQAASQRQPPAPPDAVCYNCAAQRAQCHPDKAHASHLKGGVWLVSCVQELVQHRSGHLRDS